MRRRWAFSVLLAAGSAIITPLAAQTQPPKKIERVQVVSATGCLTQEPGDSWILTNASDPVAAPGRADAQAGTKEAAGSRTTAASSSAGRNRFKLIGILEFNVPAHKGHTVTVRGLLIPAQPDRRINLTAVQMVSETCAPAGTATPAKRPQDQLTKNTRKGRPA